METNHPNIHLKTTSDPTTINNFNDQRPKVWQPFANDITTVASQNTSDPLATDLSNSVVERFENNRNPVAMNFYRMKRPMYTSSYGDFRLYHYETMRYMCAIEQNYRDNLLEQWKAALQRMFHNSLHQCRSVQSHAGIERNEILPARSPSNDEPPFISTTSSSTGTTQAVDVCECDVRSVIDRRMGPGILGGRCSWKFDEGANRSPLGLPFVRPGSFLATQGGILDPASGAGDDLSNDGDSNTSVGESTSTPRSDKVVHRDVGDNSETTDHSINLSGGSYECRQCGKEYSSQPAYAMHIRTHSRNSVCPFCGKRFSRPWLLQGHLRTHTGEKPYSCDMCSKSFADKSNLRAHQQTHSGLKPHVCRRCGKAFALKSYLYKHEESSCLKNIVGVQKKRYQSRSQLAKHKQQYGCIKFPSFIHFHN